VGWGFLWHEQGKPWLASFGLAVADDWQGRGLGRKLMDEVMKAAPLRGLREVVLTVAVDNDRAQRLYKKSGFVVTATQKGADGLDYYRMSKGIGDET
jgi:ribosomal-protein-alanine N-acetyltransferase